MTDSNPAL
jgi:20S proteasome subunit beta 2